MQESRLAYTPVSCRCTRYAYIRVSIKLPTTRHRSTTAFRSPLFPSSPINAEFTPPRTCPFPIPTRSRRPSSRLRRGTYVCVARRNGNIACILLVRVLETEIRSGATSFDRSSSSGGSKKGKERGRKNRPSCCARSLDRSLFRVSLSVIRVSSIRGDSSPSRQYR